MDAEMIIRMIRDAKKKTPAVCYLSGDLRGLKHENVRFVGGKDFGILFGDLKEIEAILELHSERISKSFPPTNRTFSCFRPLKSPDK